MMNTAVTGDSHTMSPSAKYPGYWQMSDILVVTVMVTTSSITSLRMRNTTRIVAIFQRHDFGNQVK